MSKKNKLFCSDCGNSLTQDQFKRLNEGELVYCETCGKTFQIRHIDQNSNTGEQPVSNQETNPWKKIGLDLKKNVEKGTKFLGGKLKKKFNEVKTKIQDDKPNKNNNSSQSQNPSQYKQVQNQNPPQPVIYQRQPNNNRQRNPPNNGNRGNAMMGTHQNQNRPNPIVRYPLLRRLNLFTALISLLIAIVASVVLLVFYISGKDDADFMANLTARIIRVVLAYCVFLYDYLYANRKIRKLDLEYYALDFILIGALGSIYAYGAGIPLAIKGIIMMFVALTSSVLFWKKGKKRSFGNAIILLLNNWAAIIGILIIFLNSDIFLNGFSDTNKIYAIMALVALLLDLLVLRFFAAGKTWKEIPLAIGILKTVCGILATFYLFSGFLLAIEGIFMLFASFFSMEFKD
jgi:hypothetical protein